MEMSDILKKHFESIDTKYGELPDQVKEALGRLDELEQKAARASPESLPTSAPSIGQQFIEVDQVKSFLALAEGDRKGKRIGAELKATITSATTLADGSAGDLLVPNRDMSVNLPQRALVVRDLLPTIRVTQGNTVEFPKQTGFTNNAATVAEAALKPQSDTQYDLVQCPIRTIAHWVLASRQILDDAPQLMGFIDTDMRYGLAYVEDGQLLNGAGTGTDLLGINPQATAFAAGTLLVATPTKIDAIGAALLQVGLNDMIPDGIVLNPADWTSMLMTKDAAGGYIIGNPYEAVSPRLWGLPVALSKTQAAGSFLVGAFKESATLYDRWEARVEVSTEDSDNFRRNLVTVLAEERIGLAVKRPTGFVKGTFTAALADLSS